MFTLMPMNERAIHVNPVSASAPTIPAVIALPVFIINVHGVGELGDRVANYSGQPINKRYLQVRRPEIYDALLRDLDGNLKAETPAK